MHKPEGFGVNQRCKSPGGIIVSFDHGVPTRLATPEGSYIILESGPIGDTGRFDTERFWNLLNEGFYVEVIRHQGNDKELRSEGPGGKLEYRLSDSGPLVRIKEKEENR